MCWLVYVTLYADQSFSVCLGLVIICGLHDVRRAIRLSSLDQLPYVLGRLDEAWPEPVSLQWGITITKVSAARGGVWCGVSISPLVAHFYSDAAVLEGICL